MTRSIVCLIICSLICGCTLESVPKYGENCPPEGISASVLGNYHQEVGACANDHLCIPMGTTGDYICTMQCGTDSQSKPKDVVFCAEKCIESFYDLHIDSCDADNVVKCQKGYEDCDEIVQTGCETDLNSLQNCGACGSHCSEESIANSSVVKCENQMCLATDCNEQYHLLVDGTCELDTDDECIDKESGQVINCKSANNATDGTCQSGQCVFTACEQGYHLSGNGAGNACVENSDDACGSPGNNCNTLPKVIVASCDKLNATCVVDSCESGYHPNGSECTADEADACGESGIQCPVPEHGIAVCDSGECTFECSSGYHQYNDLCEAHSLQNCGEHDIPCSAENFEHASAVSCEKGTCEIASCQSGYYLYEGICKQNSFENCGKEGVSCTKTDCLPSLWINKANSGGSDQYVDDNTICVTGGVMVDSAIKSVTMNNLIYAGGFQFKYEETKTGNLESLHLPSLERLGNKVEFTVNKTSYHCALALEYAHNIKELSLPKLSLITGTLYIKNDSMLGSISLPSLTSSKTMYFFYLPKMKKLELESLIEKPTIFTVAHNLGIEEINLPKLKEAGTVRLVDNSVLCKVNFNDAIINKLRVVNNYNLSCDNMCSLKNFSQLDGSGIMDNYEETCELAEICP